MNGQALLKLTKHNYLTQLPNTTQDSKRNREILIKVCACIFIYVPIYGSVYAFIYISMYIFTY